MDIYINKSMVPHKHFFNIKKSMIHSKLFNFFGKILCVKKNILLEIFLMEKFD
jgi:hypothetical protein